MSMHAPSDAPPDPLTIRVADASDEAALLHCHNLAFAGRAGPRTAAHWRWKFLANPTGRLWQMLAEHPRAGVVGVYAGLPLAVTCAGRRRVAVQAVDQGVRAEWLRHGGEPGLFARLGQAFLAEWLADAEPGRDEPGGRGEPAAADERALFVYGLPGAGWRTGARHLGWQIARDWDATFRELPDGAPPRPVPGDLVVRAVPRFDADVDALYGALERGFGVATVRDARYLNWRYADHPDRRHVLLECRERAHGRLRGVCVYGVGDVMRPHTSYLLDWLHPADDGDTMTALVGAAEELARRDGTGMLCSVWNHLDPRFLALQERGYRVRGTPWFLAIVTNAYDTTFFREHWYFTLGDSDLV